MLQEIDNHLCTSLCSNQVEAEVIVHSELSDPSGREEEGSERDSNTTRGLSLSEDIYSPLSQSSSPRGEEEHLENHSVAERVPSLPARTLVACQNGETEGTGQQQNADMEPHHDTCLTNGFHSPKTPGSMLKSEHLEMEDSRHCLSAAGKAISTGLPPAPFVSPGFVHSTSTAHTYLCP